MLSQEPVAWEIERVRVSPCAHVCIDYETRRKDATRAVPGSDFQRGRTTERPAPDRADLVLETLRIDSSEVWGEYRAANTRFTMVPLRDPGGQR